MSGKTWERWLPTALIGAGALIAGMGLIEQFVVESSTIDIAVNYVIAAANFILAAILMMRPKNYTE